MYNYQIKEKCANLPALEVLAELQKNPKRDVYESLVQDMAGEMLKALGDKPMNEETYCEIIAPMFKPNPKCHWVHYLWDFEELGLTVQLIPYFDNNPTIERVVNNLLPSSKISPRIQPIEYVVMHETLGLFIVMPVERWCKRPQEIFDNYVSLDEITSVYTVKGCIFEGEVIEMSLKEYLAEKEPCSMPVFKLGGKRPHTHEAFGYVGEKVYYYGLFYSISSNDTSNLQFITKEEVEKRITEHRE